MTSLSTYPPETHGGVVTSWIPLTTAFPSSAGCEKSFWSVVTGTLAGWDPGYGLYVNGAVKCFPPAATSWWDQDHLIPNALTRSSLGPFTCPDAYTTASTIVEAQSSTFVACCPSDYAFVEFHLQGVPGQCSSIVPAQELITYAFYNDKNLWTTAITSYATSTVAWGIQMNGYNVGAPKTTSTTGATSAATNAGGTLGISNSSPGLSTGATAGVGVGAALGGFALGALLVLFFARRKRRKVDASGGYMGPVVVNELQAKPALPVNELQGRELSYEAYSRY